MARAIAPGLGALACAVQLHAQGEARPSGVPDLTEMSLEQLMEVEVVYAASRRDQTQREAPSSVTLVTAAEIRRHGYRTLADLLRTIPSFYVSDDRNYEYVGVRGFGRPGDYNTRILLLVDGVRLNDNIYDMAPVGADFLLDLDLVERVEVARGPGSSIYGTSAFFAVVNVVTRRGADLDGAELVARGASFGGRGLRASYGTKAGGFDLLASASLSDSSGQPLYFPEFDRPETGNGRVDNDDESARRVLFSAGRGGLSFLAAHSSREKGVPTASYGTVFGAPDNRTTDERTWLALKYDRNLGSRLDLATRASFGRYRYDASYVYPAADGGVFEDLADGQWLALDSNLTARLGRHVLTVGGEFQENLSLRQAGGYADDPDSRFDLDHGADRWGLYAEAAVKPSERLTVHLGLRHDEFHGAASRVSPRLGLVAGLDPSTTVKLLFGDAFRAPNEYERHYYRGTDPGIRPETVRTFEGIVERFLGPRVQVRASAFWNRIGDLITLEVGPDGRLLFRNAEDFTSRGVELSAEGARRGARGRISYSFQDTRERISGLRPSNSPRHQANLALTLPLRGDRFSVGLGARYIGQRLTLAGNRTGAFVVTDLTLLARRLAGSLELSAKVRNLLDARHSDPGSEEHRQDVLQQDGRSFGLSLTWRP